MSYKRGVKRASLYSVGLLLYLLVSCISFPSGLQKQEEFSQLEFEGIRVGGTGATSHSFWGRLYIESFPDREGFQYFRAHYGIPPPLKKAVFVLADPIDLCTYRQRPGDDPNSTGSSTHDSFGTILVARRGNCTFATKSLSAIELGAAGILFVNNEDGNLHPFAQDLKNIGLTAGMISKTDGNRLITALAQVSSSSLKGKYTPMICQGSASSYCEPGSVSDSMFIDEMNFEGTVRLASTHERLPYKLAEFGGYLNHKKSWEVVVLEGADFCSDHTSALSAQSIMTIEDKESPSPNRELAILVGRGGCSFADKARYVAILKASLMILVNDDETFMPMGGAGSESSDIDIVSIMIPNSAGMAILDRFEHDEEVVVTISDTKWLPDW